MGDDDDWLVRTELEPRPTRSTATPHEAVPSGAGAADVAPRDGNLVHASVVQPAARAAEVSGTFWIVATDAEVSTVVLRKIVDRRNPFTGQIRQAEDLSLDGAMLGRLPHVRQSPDEDRGSAEAASDLLRSVGCDPDAPAMTNATRQTRVYELPDSSVAKLADGTSRELAALAQAAVGGRGKLWAYIDDLGDDD